MASRASFEQERNLLVDVGVALCRVGLPALSEQRANGSRTPERAVRVFTFAAILWDVEREFERTGVEDRSRRRKTVARGVLGADRCFVDLRGQKACARSRRTASSASGASRSIVGLA